MQFIAIQGEEQIACNHTLSQLVNVAPSPAMGAGPVQKNKPEITALALLVKVVTRTCTCPLSCHTRYCPLWKLLTFCVFSKTPLPSRMSIFSARDVVSQSRQ